MRGIHRGEMTIEGEFGGILNGTGIVPSGRSATIDGIVSGTLIVEQGAHVRITGIVNGAIVDHGATIEVSGIVGD